MMAFLHVRWCMLLLPATLAVAGLPGCRHTNTGPTHSAATPDSALHFHYHAALHLGRPAAGEIRNADGSPRITQPDAYASFQQHVAPLLLEWAADPRLNLNPNFVAAIFAKESGFEPFVTSWTPANGLAQITHIADADLRLIVADAAAFRWMRDEVESWPRHPLVHTPDARKLRTDSMTAAGVITSENEYLFDPARATRAALFWLRLLEEAWTKDEWPGAHGTYARARLNGGVPLQEHQLLDLVTVSYNQGHPYVRDLLERYGTHWKSHLNEESADYLDAVRRYTIIFQNAQR